MGKISNAQDYPSEYYNVINKDSLYVFSSDTHILFFSSPGEDGNFSYLSNISGNFNSTTNMSFNDEYFIVEDSDTLFLFDISDIYLPSLLSTTSFEFAIGLVYGFGPYFVVKVADTLKLLEINNNSLEVIEDTLLVLTRQPLFKYPYIIMRRDIYKYVENFGAYQIYIMNHDGDAGMGSSFIFDNQIVYHCIVQYDPFPPDISDLRSRLLEEPDFPILFNYHYWADLLGYYADFYSGSKRYIYLFDWRIPPNGGRIVVNFSGVTLYQHFSWDYELKLTDAHLFQLGDNILYSNPSAPSVFFELEYTITSIEVEVETPNTINLKSNYPNPFNPTTNIEFILPERAFVKLVITNILGQHIATLINEEKPAGIFITSFNGSDIPSGAYFYTLIVNDLMETKKMVITK